MKSELKMVKIINNRNDIEFTVKSEFTFLISCSCTYL